MNTGNKIDSQLKSIFNEHLTESPSANFSANFFERVNQIELEQSVRSVAANYKQINLEKVLYIYLYSLITITIATIVIVLLNIPEGNNVNSVGYLFNNELLNFIINKTKRFSDTTMTYESLIKKQFFIDNLTIQYFTLFVAITSLYLLVEMKIRQAIIKKS